MGTFEHFPTATVADFQANAATGTFSSPQNINDNNTATPAEGLSVDQYCEIDFGKIVIIGKWRMFGHSSNDGDGAAKIQYWDIGNATWEDWVTGIPTRIAATWSDFTIEETIFATTKVRFTVTALPTDNDYRVGELEVIY